MRPGQRLILSYDVSTRRISGGVHNRSGVGGMLQSETRAESQRTVDNGLLSEEIANYRNGIIIALVLIDL
jgi:hypothetical protein